MLKLALSKLSFAVVNGHVKLLSRIGLSLKTKFATTAQEIRKLKVKSVLLDGEIMVFDEQVIARFALLQNVIASRMSRRP